MQNLLSLLQDQSRPLQVQRSGAASLCRLASDVVAQGRTSVLVAQDATEFARYRSLLPLFSRESDEELQDPARPQWDRRIQTFSPFVQRRDRETIAQDLAALYAMQRGQARCLVLSLEALLLNHVPLDFFTRRTLVLADNQEFAPAMILDQLLAWGYERVSMVARAGDVAMRGDILDIFPAGYRRPVRIEFFGDNIDEMRIFDADTQRSQKNIDEVILLPIRICSLSIQEKQSLTDRITALAGNRSISENMAYAVKKLLEEHPDRLLPGVCFENPTRITDWVPGDAVWCISEENELLAALEELRTGLRTTLESDEETADGTAVQNDIQPAQIALCSSPDAPWRAFPTVIFARQIFGDTREGTALPERSISSFEALFPEKEAQDRPWQTIVSAIRKWRSEYRQILLCFSTQRGRTKFVKLAEQDGILPALAYDSRTQGLFALIAPFRKGCEMVWDSCLILGEDILFPKARRTSVVPRGKFRGLRSFDDIREGDLLVHREYGIGRFGGLHHLTVNNCANDYLLIEYAGHDKLYVPADNLAVIQRYKGGDSRAPALDRLGGAGWKASRDKARKAIEQIAADLVEMYAYRKVVKGFHYGPVSDLYHEFEATFDYEETPDQAKAIQDVLDDMAGDTPMDRLICGDVGFGKTEVAMRAAFRAASEGRQVALLCPTTVLAEQHYQTFRSRLQGFPITVGLLSRFVSRTKQTQVLQQAARGSLDILIGTHRLLSSDVQLPNLGLLILDEEQRFGVRHKEQLKAMKKNVDVLTLTATPIPRTLQLSMSGIRDLSLIETPPENRKPVETYIIHRDQATLRNVLERELERKGQVFWIYNRVRGLETCADYVRKLCPAARVEAAHGQMSESVLEDVMYRFWHGEIDVLVCTTIVESGLDCPNVNTIVVDQAQMFGLGQLYQLRGRVGRSDRQAYAYLVVPNTTSLTRIADERLRILQEMDYLGSGFQLAMEDLRLRGAGNILGEMQSGQMNRMGLDLYLEMLENTVARLKGLPETNLSETELTLGLPAHIPVTYMDDNSERMRFYKALTSAQSPKEREEIMLEIRDRFGPLPAELVNFMSILNLKQVLTRLQVGRAEIGADHVLVTWQQGQQAVRPERILRFVHAVEGAKVTPPASVYFPVDTKEPFEKALDVLRVRLLTLLEPDEKRD